MLSVLILTWYYIVIIIKVLFIHIYLYCNNMYVLHILNSKVYMFHLMSYYLSFDSFEYSWYILNTPLNVNDNANNAVIYNISIFMFVFRNILFLYEQLFCPRLVVVHVIQHCPNNIEGHYTILGPTNVLFNVNFMYFFVNDYFVCIYNICSTNNGRKLSIIIIIIIIISHGPVHWRR